MADILILRLRPGRPVGTNTICSSFQAAAIKLRARSLIHVKAGDPPRDDSRPAKPLI